MEVPRVYRITASACHVVRNECCNLRQDLMSASMPDWFREVFRLPFKKLRGCHLFQHPVNVCGMCDMLRQPQGC
jgi:hypothetical protein